MIAERGAVRYANPAYARLAGYRRPADVVGCSVAKQSVPVPALQEQNGRATRTYDTLRFEFHHGRRTIELHVVRDVTDRRALESRLLESEKMEAFGRLVGGVAHDFNNILTAITLHSELLRERHVEGGSEVEEIRVAAQRGADLVRQLLTFARQHPAAPQVVSLSKAISGMTAVVEPLIGEDIQLVVDFAAKRDWVRADLAQLQQVVLNLAMNARDALPRGGRISIHTCESELDAREAARHGVAAGHYVCLTVDDNGCGMKEEVRVRIFEPFFTTKEHGTGTGLGMSMVYRIVTQAGGSVSVASKEGKGTRVTVLLPRVALAQPETVVEKSETAPRGHETVLIAEDDAVVRGSIASLLTARGYRVLQASNGLHAVRTAQVYKRPIHLLLSDVVMPRMNGIDAAANVRQLHPEAKVLFMSGYPAKAATVAFPKALLFKPFSRTVLERKVRETLEERPPASKAAHGHAP
jgi:signal transduction histidine kinase/ActR/RegA family two-component response regulator